MHNLFAQLDPDQAVNEGYWTLALIAAIGLAGVLTLVFLYIGRRWARRQLQQIEKDKAERRRTQSAGRVDAWRAGADRYVDRDKLPDDDDPSYPGDDAEGFDDLDDDADLEEDDDAPPPGWGDDDEPPEQDPYGLFDGKPYRDPDDDEEDDYDDDDDPDEDGWDPDDEKDDRRR